MSERLARALFASEAESQNQFLTFVQELLGNRNLGDFNVGEDSLAIPRTRPLIMRVCRRVLPHLLSCLQKIRTVARAIQRYLALLAAALRTDSPVHGRAKPFLFSFVTERATQRDKTSQSIISRKRLPPGAREISLAPGGEFRASDKLRNDRSWLEAGSAPYVMQIGKADRSHN
jgi:hypothetical protein